MASEQEDPKVPEQPKKDKERYGMGGGKPVAEWTEQDWKRYENARLDHLGRRGQ